MLLVYGGKQKETVQCDVVGYSVSESWDGRSERPISWRTQVLTKALKGHLK